MPALPIQACKLTVSLSSFHEGLFILGKELSMNNENTASINAADSTAPLPVQGNECPALVKKIGKTTYRVTIHFSATSSETMSNKIKRMLRNEVSQM
jgi:hypothetical protein